MQTLQEKSHGLLSHFSILTEHDTTHHILWGTRGDLTLVDKAHVALCLRDSHARNDPCDGWLMHHFTIHHTPVSHCFVEQLTSAFISPLITENPSNQLSVRDFYNDFLLKIACIRGTECLVSLSCGFGSALAANFSLSVFKCCLALLILSGKLEHKSGESSFILMSQVLDLLKSEYWNGLELGTFKGLRIHSACGADLCWGNEFFPPRRNASLALFLLFFRSLLFLQSHFCWIPHAVWQEFYANASSLGKGGRGRVRGDDRGPGFIQQTSCTGCM